MVIRLHRMALARRKSDDVSLVCAWCASVWNCLDDVASAAPGKTGIVIMGCRSVEQIDREQGWVFPDGTAPAWLVLVVPSHARTREERQDPVLLCHCRHTERDCARTAARRRGVGCGQDACMKGRNDGDWGAVGGAAGPVA